MDLRIGQGVDVHRLVAGRPCVLAGVTIPSEVGPEGHSDADVVLHAVTDALLGATGRGDIGTYFPNTDERWRGADSALLLRTVYDEIRAAGWRVVNVDLSIIAEVPKITPHVPRMKESLAGLLGVTHDAVGVKATTMERLGAIGRAEGILVFAVALLQRG